LSDEEKEAGVALVDIGGGTTDIAIFQDGIIRHTAVIPFGGNVLTEDIRQGCLIMKKQAEQLKQRFGSAISTEMKDNEIVCIPGLQGRNAREISLKNLAAIIEARMTEIIEHVHFEIRNSGFSDQLIGGVVLTGGGSQLRHVTQLFQYVTGLDCRVGYPSEHLAEAPDAQATAPSFATGVGLVIKGYDRLAPKSDSIKADDIRKDAEKSQHMRLIDKLKNYFVEEEEED
jgi:cell division protein FtsA